MKYLLTKIGRPPNKESKVCRHCGKKKGTYAYYTATNSLTSSDGKYVDICKDCLKKMSTNEDGTINIDKFKSVLRLLDKPYLNFVLEQTIKEAISHRLKNGKEYNIIGLYFKNIASLPQYSGLNYADSLTINSENIVLPEMTIATTRKKVQEAQKKKELLDNEDVYISAIEDFKVTDEMRDLFGDGFSKQEYKLMMKKYDDLKINYPIKTNMHKEFLVDYVKCKVKEELAIVEGDIEAVSKWSQLSAKAAENAKITPKQLTAADLQGGLSSFSEIFEAVEGARDVIPILPKFKQQPNDMPDFIIWNYINYERNLNNLPCVEYEDIYKFYDKKKDEYIKEHGDPFGIFENDLSQSQKQRDTVKKFITIVEDGDNNE